MRSPLTSPRITATAVAVMLLIGGVVANLDPVHAKPGTGWHPGPAQDIEMRLERMTMDLDLTDGQQARIREIMEADRSRREQQRLELHNQIDAVLTEAQRETRDARLQRLMARRLDRMTERFDLSEEQVDQIKALFEQQRTNPALSRTQMREQISGILTAEQRAAFQSHRPKRWRGD